jgi:hypothetical protein
MIFWSDAAKPAKLYKLTCDFFVHYFHHVLDKRYFVGRSPVVQYQFLFTKHGTIADGQKWEVSAVRRIASRHAEDL